MVVKVGYGIDFHRFARGRRLVLGGVDIDYPMGLEGHSDADVIIHAVSDAILGSAGLGDIGRHFPETPQFRGISSMEILKRVKEMLPGDISILHIDLTFIGEEPRISPYASRMKNKIADILEIEEKDINIKATTSEGMGVVGDRKGVACQAIVTIEIKGDRK